MNDSKHLLIAERHGRLCQLIEMMLDGEITIDLARSEWDKVNAELPIGGPNAHRIKEIVDSAEADD